MDAQQIRELEPKLDRFLERFADCFARKDTRAHLGVYVRGQLSNLPEKSVEPIALAMRRGDPDFRLAVDTALSHIYRKGEITGIFKTAFGPLTTPSPLLAALYQMAGLPD